MGGIVPEPLVTVRGYPTPELAEGDHRLLVEAGLDASISSTYFGHHGYSSTARAQVQLRVPKSQKEEASRLLATSEEVFPLIDSNRPRDPELSCPLCHASDPDPLPPYGLLVALGLLGAFGLLVYLSILEPVIEMVVAIVAFGSLPWFAAKFPKWRCKACGTRWGDDLKGRLVR